MKKSPAKARRPWPRGAALKAHALEILNRSMTSEQKAIADEVFRRDDRKSRKKPA